MRFHRFRFREPHFMGVYGSQFLIGPIRQYKGTGQQGKEAIGKFYDTFSASQASMDFEVHHMAWGGNEAACFVTMKFTLTDGTSNEGKLLNVYKMSPNGKIASLRSFWNY